MRCLAILDLRQDAGILILNHILWAWFNAGVIINDIRCITHDTNFTISCETNSTVRHISQTLSHPQTTVCKLFHHTCLSDEFILLITRKQRTFPPAKHNLRRYVKIISRIATCTYITKTGWTSKGTAQTTVRLYVKVHFYGTLGHIYALISNC